MIVEIEHDNKPIYSLADMIPFVNSWLFVLINRSLKEVKPSFELLFIINIMLESTQEILFLHCRCNCQYMPIHCHI